MDGQKQSDATEAKAEKPERRSFMDIRRPKSKDEEAPATTDTAKPATTAAPAEPKAQEPAAPEKVTAAPPEEDKAEITDDPAQKLAETENTKPAKAPKPPKPPRQPGVSLAIFATVIIILGLGALATYAYLRTNNIAPF